jgi:hypothetical protein
MEGPEADPGHAGLQLSAFSYQLSLRDDPISAPCWLTADS